jgi:putative DNA primase/helicase
MSVRIAHPGAEPFEQAAAWRADLFPGKKGELYSPELSNLALILKRDPAWNGVIALDEFSGRVMKLQPPPFERGEPGEWVDVDDTRARIWFAQHGYRIQAQSRDVTAAIDHVADLNRFHEVRQYLTGLRWDGRARLKYWLVAYLDAEVSGDAQTRARRERYFEVVGTKWMISAVARVMRPGSKADYVLILEGKQRTGKSTALKILAGEKWFLDTPLKIGDKDAYQALRGKWIVELAELDALGRAEASAAKAFFSSAQDHYRASFGHRSASVPRQCVFAGTVNHRQYLRDDTGNTRYWPVACGSKIALTGEDSLTSMRDQLWAEAVHLYQQGHPWWPLPEEWPLLLEEQEQREIGDAWESPILRMLEDPLEDPETGRYTKPDQVTMAQLLGGALGLDKSRWTKAEQTRVGAIMARLGWKRTRSVTGYYYKRPPERSEG